MAQERHPDPALYSMLVGALGALADDAGRPDAGGALLLPEGARPRGRGPVLDECAACGEPDGAVELVAFDLVAGGHAVPGPSQRPPHEPGRAGPAAPHPRRGPGAVLAGPPPPAADEVAELATEAMEAHLDRRIRSVRSTAGL